MTSHPSYLLRTSIPPSAIIGIAVVVLMAGDTRRIGIGAGCSRNR